MQDSLAEVAMGELTLQKSNNDKVKQFARKVIDDRTKMNEQMRPIAQQMGVDIPSEASKKDKSQISKMQSLSGPAYDQAYIKDVAKNHKQNDSEFRLEVANALPVGLKNVALESSKTIEDDLQLDEQLAKDQNVDLAKK
jgi:putative membrane protein